jgi:hypothetical protein
VREFCLLRIKRKHIRKNLERSVTGSPPWKKIPITFPGPVVG